jgi:hypothetical protein
LLCFQRKTKEKKIEAEAINNNGKNKAKKASSYLSAAFSSLIIDIAGGHFTVFHFFIFVLCKAANATHNIAPVCFYLIYHLN